MYLPSLATGMLIARFGERPVIAAGTLIMGACIAIAIFAGHAVLHYLWALTLLGLGWNFMFIAATTLLTRTYRPAERIQTQTLNDFLVFGAQAVASLMAGLALATIGWRQLNISTLPLIATVLIALAATARQRRRLAA
jgi:MFS family permease